jgi:hypothetical protein
MGDYNIRTVKDYLLAVQFLHQDCRGDDFREGAERLAKLAEGTIFKAKQHQLTSRGHREYRLDYRGLVENLQSSAKHIPVVLVNPGDYEFGSKVHVATANHLDDEVAA